MRRRRTWGLTALVAMLAMPIPARSESALDRSPKVHVAGIGVAASGGPRSGPVLKLVRAGSDLRGSPAASSGSVSAPSGGIVWLPTVVPPTFDGVPDLAEVSPGDPTGALGMTHHLAAVNVHMAFYDRGGARAGSRPGASDRSMTLSR